MAIRQEQWQLAGSAAEIYQQYLVPAIFGPWAPVLVEAASLQSGEQVLDVACGTSVVAREAAGRVGIDGKVIGLDLNPGMLAVARSLGPNRVIEWQEGDASAMPFPDAAFDIVFCQLGLQYFPDRPKALGEMNRVLASAGRLVLMVWRSIAQSPGFGLLADALERHVGAPAAAIMRAPFCFASPEEVRALILGAGFQDVNVRAATGTVRFPSAEHFVQYQVAGSPLAGPVGQASEAAKTALINDMKATARAYKDGEGLAFPMGAYIATGHV
jgi:SAM-dependent methyltransferase